MSLKNLLLSATGIVGRGSFFQWCLAVSDALGGSSSGSVYPQYAFGKGIAVQNLVGANTTLSMEGIGLVNGIPRSDGNANAWVLTPGKIYLLTGGGYFDTFSDTTGGVLRIDWVDDTNTPLQSGSSDFPSAWFSPGTNTTARSTSSGLSPFIFSAPASDQGRVVKLRCTAGTGTASKPQSSWGAALIEIPVAA